MKKIVHLFMVISSILFYKNANAQHVGTISKFEILPSYLTSDGKIKISTGSKTEIKYKVSFSRQLSNTGPVGSFKPFNMTVMLSTSDANNGIVLFFPSNKITSANFKENNSFLLDQEFTAEIDNSKLSNGKPIILGFITDDKDFPIYSFDNKVYHWTLASETPNPSNGDFINIYANRPGYNAGLIILEPSSPRNGTFKAYSSYVDGAMIIKEFRQKRGIINDSRTGTSSPFYVYHYVPMAITDGDFYLNDWEYTGKKFYAFNAAAKAPLTIYQYEYKIYGSRFFTTNKIEDARYEYKGILCYAFPPPSIPTSGGGTRPTRGDEGRPNVLTTSITPDKWTLDPDGLGYSVFLSDIVANLSVSEINYIHTLGDEVPSPSPRGGTARQIIMLPGSYQGNNYSFNLFNKDIVITVKNTSTTPPTSTIDFSLAYYE